MSLLLVACGIPIFATATAVADAPAPGWDAIGQFTPTNLVPGGEGTLTLHVFNVGASRGEGATLTDALPKGLTANGGIIRAEGGEPSGFTCTGTSVVTCILRTSSSTGYTNSHPGAIYSGEDVVVESRLGLPRKRRVVRLIMSLSAAAAQWNQKKRRFR